MEIEYKYGAPKMEGSTVKPYKVTVNKNGSKRAHFKGGSMRSALAWEREERKKELKRELLKQQLKVDLKK